MTACRLRSLFVASLISFVIIAFEVEWKEKKFTYSSTRLTVFGWSLNVQFRCLEM